MTLPYSDNDIKALLDISRNIAIVGLSPKENRPSHMVARYLRTHGYRIIPVNPGQHEILGYRCYSDLSEIEEHVDIVNIFRRSEDTPPVVEQAAAIGARVVWMQQGIMNEKAATTAKKNGLICIMDSCIKIEHARLFG
ncbi:MAG: CoA-binding protein [Desulfobacterales bacterium]|nr:MAG: CoA-binding protein [Desulfobacterales bacterium]